MSDQSPRPTDADVRAGIQQAKVGETGLTVLGIEVLIYAVVAGRWSQSWAVGIFTGIILLFGLIAIAKFEKAAGIVSVFVGVGWAVVAFIAARHYEIGDAGAFGFAVLAWLIGAGIHIVAFQHIRDLDLSKG